MHILTIVKTQLDLIKRLSLQHPTSTRALALNRRRFSEQVAAGDKSRPVPPHHKGPFRAEAVGGLHDGHPFSLPYRELGRLVRLKIPSDPSGVVSLEALKAPMVFSGHPADCNWRPFLDRLLRRFDDGLKNVKVSGRQLVQTSVAGDLAGDVSAGGH